MTELLQPGEHPDADLLSAFSENALGPQERAQTMMHLAVCPDCRAVLVLAMPPLEAVPERIPERRAWWMGWRMAWPVAGALAMLVPVAMVYRHDRALRGRPQPAEVAVAMASPPPSLAEPVPLARPAIRATSPPVASPASPKAEVRVPARGAPAGVMGGMGAAPAPMVKVPAAVGSETVAELPLVNRQFYPLPEAQGMAAQGKVGGAGAAPVVAGLAFGAGSGAADAPAQPAFALRAPKPAPAQMANLGVITADTETSRNGQVLAASLTASDGIVAAHPLPSRLPALSVATYNGRTLAIDTQHQLYLTQDDGRHWMAVASPWSSHAVRVVPAGLTVGTPVVTAKVRAGSGDSAIVGVVTDSTGAAIPGAVVTVTRMANPVVHSVKADDAGHYSVSALESGRYTMTATAANFKVTTLKDVALDAGQVISENLSLAVGGSSEQITVEAAAIGVETEGANTAPFGLSAQAKQKALKQVVPAARVAAMAPAVPIFEVVTDTGERWGSVDGRVWLRR